MTVPQKLVSLSGVELPDDLAFHSVPPIPSILAEQLDLHRRSDKDGRGVCVVCTEDLFDRVFGSLFDIDPAHETQIFCIARETEPRWAVRARDWYEKGPTQDFG